MSGGVDSSVSAVLLKKHGYSVTGVFMRPWQPAGVDCLWRQDREDALRAAAKLDIPLLTWNLSKEYEKYVAEYMIREYKKGLTPNPDIMCNKFIKFGVFLQRALKLGADFIATGHYVIKVGDKLLKAKDLNKDQSYFLYTLTRKQLKHCLFPIGDYTKDKVRQMAKKFGLPNWDKKDSQGVCFVGSIEFGKFLKRYIKPKTGLVVRKSDGQILGEHDGAWYYTIGQRHGLHLNGGRPYYIVGKDIQKNILYADKKVISNKLELRIKEFNWVNGGKKHWPMNCKVKTRYRQKDLDCTMTKNGGAVAEVKIAAEDTPIAPGQSAVFYKGNELLGGGVII